MVAFVLAFVPAFVPQAGASREPPNSGAAFPVPASQSCADSEGFRQGVRYSIEAILDEDADILRSAAILEYANRSPDTLRVLYLHLHLNAFRPNSLWARTERRPAYDFQALLEPDTGFERLLSARLDGRPLAAQYPYAPDSTVVRLTLPAPLLPGDSLTLSLEWEARPSTLCRRQCRSGRHYDFAQWYPRIAVYDRDGWRPHPLLPQGEFYGEFATYDVTLELAADQVVGATGVPLSGDPGWRLPAGSSGMPVYRRDAYGHVPRGRSPGLLPSRLPAGRKRVRFYAEEVHHFAWSVDPDYRYEGAVLERAGSDRSGDVAIRVLYRPGEEASWGGGVVVDRTIAALGWVEEIFGRYPYPQLTNLSRLEAGGTEFPMLVMNGSAGEGLIFHEVAHQFAHGILANNEWLEAWLDEGMADFLTTWHRERSEGPEAWRSTVLGLAQLERLGLAQPVSTPAEEFASFELYGAMTYAKASVIYRMLRELMGEARFRRFLEEYYGRCRFHHVSESDVRRIAEEVHGGPLGWFFDAWLHGTGVLDYAVEDVSLERRLDGSWSTTVEIGRRGEIWMPIVLRVDDVLAVAESPDRRQLLEIVTPHRPRVVELDPEFVLLDADRANNRVELPP